MEKYLECAKIVGTHGVHGAVRLSSMCDSPEVLASLKRMYYRRGGALEELCVKSAFVHKSMVVASFDGVDSLDGAIAMRDLVLYADRDDIPRRDGDFFISDLIGLSVKDAESGEVYGTLSDVISPAGRDIYVVKKPSGGEFMIPCVGEFVKRISPEEDHAIFVKLIEGMTD